MTPESQFVKFEKKVKLLRVALILMINFKKKQCTKGKLCMLHNISLMLQTE